MDFAIKTTTVLLNDNKAPFGNLNYMHFQGNILCTTERKLQSKILQHRIQQSNY